MVSWCVFASKFSAAGLLQFLSTAQIETHLA
jgi:hypothetical protein